LFHQDLAPGADPPRPGVPDADHAGGFGGHRALASAAAHSEWNSLVNLVGRPEGYRSLAHGSFSRASQAGQPVLLTGLAMDRRFIAPPLCCSMRKTIQNV
jgi:hypothetical protein